MYSFDIFDTLISRRTANPQGIFMIMQELIKKSGRYVPFLENNFSELRTGSEKLARAHAESMGKKEVTLSDIYKVLCMTTHITEDQQEELENLEIETEYKNVLGIIKNIDLLKQLVNQGEHVVLISDMYLGENSIRHILEQVDSIFLEIPIYVSSDYGATKGTGELFRIVRSIEKVDYSDWTHYGDNEYGDVEAAKRLGIKVEQVIPEETKEYEYPEKDLYHQLSVGISKYIRSGGMDSVAGEVGSSLAGPILYPYVKWVLDESLAREINRLYFVARDGWILQQIADRIIRIEQYPIMTHYIYGSREAWKLPSYDGSIEAFDRLIWSSMGEALCLNDYEEIFKLGVNEVKDALPAEHREKSGEEKLPGIYKDTINRLLRGNEDFRNHLVQSQKENRRLAIEYLKQEMDVSDDKFAFVELAGTGITQECLADLIGNFYQGKIRNYYFKLTRIHETGQCSFISFYPNGSEKIFLGEHLCRAPHGQTKAYMERGGHIEPVLEPYEGEQLRAYGMEEYRNAVLAYVEQMENTFVNNGIPSTIRVDITREYNRLIAQNPPERIAEYFCYMPFSACGRKNALTEFAPPVTRKQLRKIYFWQDVVDFRNVYSGDSLEYALVVSPKAMRYSERCREYSKSGIGKLLVDLKRYMCMHQKPGLVYFCPWELLRGKIVIYGAGKVGQDYVKQAKQRYAKCDSLLWVDKNYIKLQEKGWAVKTPEEIRKYSFDRIIVAIHDNSARQEIEEMLCEMGVEAGKIYYG